VPPPKRHYFVCFDGPRVGVEHVLPGRFGTLTEVNLLARWLEAHPDLRSVLVVSNDTHLRRIRLCCRSLLNPKIEITFLAAPGNRPPRPEPTASEPEENHPRPDRISSVASAADQLLELFKLVIYWVLLKIR
jgi:uncharacterized SAM-binding protein YcdF (DUF218 family)